MKPQSKVSKTALISVLATAATLSLPHASQAREEKAIKSCSSGNSFEFSVDWERSKVDFDFDIERGAAFERWTVRIKRDDQVLVRRNLRSDEDGDLSREFVRRGQLNAGEKWTFSARSESGNSCKATVKF